MSEYIPYNGEESELRDFLEDIFDTNSSQIDFQELFKKNVINHTQNLTEHDVVDRIDQVSREIHVYESKKIIVFY